MFNLVKQKGIFPYDYITGHHVFFETQLPSIDQFYSILTQKGITDEEYEHAKNVCRVFNLHNLGEYNDFYLLTDTLLLADVMENFRSKFNLDPAHYLTAPSLSWDRLLFESEQRLELLTDYDMLLIIEKGIRGGVSSIMGSRYCKAYNKYICLHNYKEPTTEIFDVNEFNEIIKSLNKPNYIHYIDANNLYGWAMQQYLPTGDFKWIWIG